jgi:cephalosporin hydroxylase
MIVKTLSRKPMRAEYFSIFNKDKKIIVVHETEAIPHIHRIISEFNPELIIEFGTSWGGVTLILHECNIEAELHSYDIDCPRKPDKTLFNENVKFHIEDILSKPIKQIIKLCEDNRRKVLYCDNGNKIKEIKMYSVYLNVGDILGVHDWNKEIKLSDIEEYLVDFMPIEHELFEKNNWSTRFWKKIKTS